ncbi:serine hydrolase [Bacillus mojavensis]|uniref:serine hydrolase n=1 Tax=Bacillus mojavensis TaxID=72360 RepID=UPI002281B476|nr:serine hydrolase [Bacillus mojavensis]MCY8106122.1 class A beta-lactamase-related serine hydrolase [Bacillus mojavensis]MCY8483095.1 class A beta-lactamase-related serine hydrolase [Bacillus mojavensis]
MGNVIMGHADLISNKERGNSLFLIVLILIVAVFLFGFFGLAAFLKRRDRNRTVEDLTRFMFSHPERFSLTIIQNDQILLNHNGSKMFPLASTVKILFLLAFVHEVRKNQISFNDTVSIIEIDKFYIPNTDGGAHDNWKSKENIGQTVTMKEVLIGMMRYSSNACTDYIYLRVGKDNIQKIIDKYLPDNHTPVFSINSSMLVAPYLKKYKKKKTKEISGYMKEMKQKYFMDISGETFDALVHGKAAPLISSLPSANHIEIQKEFTRKLPSSSSENYASLMYRLGTGDLLSEVEKGLLDEITGQPNPQAENRIWYKGGSTLFVMTSAIFKETASDSISLAFFIEDMNRLDMLWIDHVYQPFLQKITTEPLFRQQLIADLKDKL